MSNNQKAVKYNPSNSKNDIGVALLRNLTKVFVKKQILAFRQFFRVSRGLITYPMPISRHDIVQIPDYPQVRIRPLWVFKERSKIEDEGLS